MLNSNSIQDLRSIVVSLLPKPRNEAARDRAEKYLKSGVVSSAVHPDVAFDDGGLWAERGARSHERFLHGLMFFSDWYGTVLSDPAQVEEARAAASGMVSKWIELHSDIESAPSMAYHDETTAQRLISLIGLRQAILDGSDHHYLPELQSLMSSTAALLAQDDFHATGNNHGMYQDLALLYHSIMSDEMSEPRRVEYCDLAMERLKQYFYSCFTSEGVHIENTPTYHVLVSRHVANVKRLAETAGHPDASGYAALIANAERYATHAIMPNGVFPPVSDTQQVSLSKSKVTEVFGGPGFAYASSVGKKGRKPEKRTLILPESGYAIYRSAWGDPKATFAFFSAAYNADYHKHSDDLSFYLRSQGIDLLSEAGPFGYDYSDPLTKYAYSQFAHNSLVVDGRSLPRTDGKKDCVKLQDIAEGNNTFTVRGTNSRYADVVHQRTVEMREAEGIPEFDLVDDIAADEDHSYELLWHLGTDVKPVLHGQGVELFHRGKKVMDLHVTANVSTRLSLTKGQTKPPRGWKFPKFGSSVPSNVLSIKFSGKACRLKTSIRLENFTYVDRRLNAPAGERWQTFQSSVPVRYLLKKNHTGQSEKLVVAFSAMGQRGDFTFNYKKTLDTVRAHTLYILDDYGDQGAYYYSDHRSLDIFDSVQELIKSTVDQLDLQTNDVATIGSSKGGAAALLHGSRLPAGKIIVGAPQTRIGSFVKQNRSNVLEFMTGGTAKEDIEYLDRVVFEALSGCAPTTEISILVGEADHHLRNHVRPLISYLQENTSSCPQPSTLVLPGMKHSEIGKIYRRFLQANLHEWMRGGNQTVVPYELQADSDERVLKVNTCLPAGYEVAFRLYEGNSPIKYQDYSRRDTATFCDLQGGRYRVRIFSRSAAGEPANAFTTDWVQL